MLIEFVNLKEVDDNRADKAQTKEKAMKLSVHNQPTTIPPVAPWEDANPPAIVTEYQDEADLNPAPSPIVTQ